MKSATPSSRRSTLIGLARRCQVVDPRAATGRCLAASLELAIAAHRRGIAVTLVRWKVRDDAEFVDHWAVRLDARHVIDLTRVQVDRSQRLVVDIDDYPANYVDCRSYPASLVLADFVLASRAGGETLPAGVMLRMARAMFRFDVMTALRNFFPVRVLVLAAELGGAHWRVGQGALAKALQDRRDGLVRKLG